MRSLMLKLLTITIALSSMLFSAEPVVDIDKKIIGFLEKAIAPNENYKFDKVTIVKKEDLKDASGWKVYFVRIDLSLVKQEGKKVAVHEILFTNGKVISKDFLDATSGKSIKNNFSLDIEASAYKKEHLLAGNFNAPNKLVIFSDPLCPFCMDYVPEVITAVEKNPETFALFYYHFPLSIHPSSPALVKAMLVAEEKGDKDIVKKMYNEIIDLKTADEKIILETFNQVFKTNITLEEINQAHILKKLTADYDLATSLMINGTPTIFLNGKKDDTRTNYKKLIKEKK